MGKKKWVSFPINVPDSDFCWKSDENIICEYFDNEGGHAHCEMDFTGQKRTKEHYVLKSVGCKILVEILERRK